MLQLLLSNDAFIHEKWLAKICNKKIKYWIYLFFLSCLANKYGILMNIHGLSFD